MTNHLLFTTSEEGVATITLNRPDKHNAFDDVLIQDLLHLLQQIKNNPKIKIVLLCAEGKSFSAGADLHWMRRMASYSYEDNIHDATALSDLMYNLKFLNKPTIACVQGTAVGGGIGLIACCDIAIASTQAVFCFPEVKIGLIPAVISPYVIAAIGERAARYYFLTAEPINANEALHLGLVMQVVEAHQLEKATKDIIAHLLQNSPQAMRATKELINRMYLPVYGKEQLEKNIEAIATIRVSKEGQEGLTAFLEKRKPLWS